MQRQIVGDGLAGVAAIEAENLLEVRDSDLLNILADLDLRDDGAVGILHGDELIHAAEHGLGLGCNHALAHAEEVDLRALEQHVLNEVLVEGVGDGYLAVRPAGLVEHLARLPGEIGEVARVETDAALGDALGLEHLVEGADGVGDAGVQRVVGVDEESGVRGIQLAVGPEGLILTVEHLNPRVRHRPARGDAVDLVGDGACRTGDAADIGRARTDNRGVCPLCAAGAELKHRAAARGADNAVGLRRDQALVVDGQERERLNELRLDSGGTDDDERLLRKDGRPLRDGVDIAREAEILQIVQKLLAEEVPAAEIGDVLLGEVQVLDIVDQLLQARRDGEAAAVGHLAEKNIKIGDAVLVAGLEVTIAHRQLVEVAEHGHVQLFLSFHPQYLKVFLIFWESPQRCFCGHV